MLLKIGDTIINTDNITYITYRRDPLPDDVAGDYPAKALYVHFTGGKTQTYANAIADVLWQRLSRDLEVVASPESEKPLQSK